MRSLALALGLSIAVLGCSGTEAEAPQPEETPAPVVAPAPVPPPAPAVAESPLHDPEGATDKAPDQFRVQFDTTDGPFVIEVNREWAPLGADRFYNLVKLGFFDGVGFFRSMEDFMVQFGINPDPSVTAKWREASIQDDPVVESNKKGRITFGTAGPNSRTTQVFINFKDNPKLDQMGFAPFGEVVEGMEIVDGLHKTGEGDPRGPGPNQGKLQERGNAYLTENFPELDYIKTARLVE